MKNKELTKAKEYALHSLTCRDQTEFQIRQKLLRREYDQETVEAVLLFLKEYNYINDARFVEQYVACHCKILNRRQLIDKLYAKGLKVDDIDQYLTMYQYDEEALLERAVEKYLRNKKISDEKDYRKVVAHFMQKGYSYTMIRSILHSGIRVSSE